MRAAMQAEHDHWIELCGRLRVLNAVTQDDLESKESSQDTRGQRLLSAKRRWGWLEANRRQLTKAWSEPKRKTTDPS
jgi:hypothetical protein